MTCRGPGRVPCETCNGKGKFVETHRVSLGGQLTGSLGWRQVPEPVREVLNTFGVSKLVQGHADISVSGSRATSLQQGQVDFVVRVPVGELAVRAGAETFHFDVVGKQAVAVSRGPFIELLAQRGTDELAKAARGRTGAAHARMRHAMRYDLVRTAVYVASWMSLPKQALQGEYPTLSAEEVGARIEDARAASLKSLKAKARGLRRLTIVLWTPVLAVWFTLGFRRACEVRPIAWPDLLFLLGLVWVGSFWIQRRLLRAARRIGFEARGKPEMKWSEFKRETNHLPNPGPGRIRLFFLLVLASALALEIGSGLEIYANHTWTDWRQDWQVETRGFWKTVRDPLEPVLVPLREFLDQGDSDRH